MGNSLTGIWAINCYLRIKAIIRKGKSMKLAGILAIIWLALISLAFTSDHDQYADQLFNKMITAIQERDYDSFVADGNPTYKAALSRSGFEEVCGQIGPQLKTEFTSSYLGQLQKQGQLIYLWKLEFESYEDDLLVKLVLKDGLVAGFWLQ